MATKNPFPEERGLPACEPYLPHALASDASELAPASRRTGCCGFAGPGPPPLWIRLCFFFSPARELTRKVRLCQCAAFQSAASDAAQARGIRDLSASGDRLQRGLTTPARRARASARCTRARRASP